MIGIIAGSGIYDQKIINKTGEKEIKTPYGKPSDKIILGELQGKEIAFLPRHGFKHTISPSNVNYRANIFALKELGCDRILAFTAVGSLRENIQPGTIVFSNQFIDRTYDRERTFYDKDKVCHISVADPFCPELRKALIESAKGMKIGFEEKGTYLCIEGPRFSTRAESKLFQSWGAHIIGMTLCPEVVLAREAELCYANIATVTDYDTFKEKPVSIEEVIKVMKENNKKMKQLLEKVVPKISEKRNCACGSALDGALI